MSLPIALTFALPTIDKCEKLQEDIRSHPKGYVMNIDIPFSTYQTELSEIYEAVSTFEGQTKKTIKAKLDPNLLSYFDKFRQVVCKYQEATPPGITGLYHHMSSSKMAEYLDQQLSELIKEIEPYTKKPSSNAHAAAEPPNSDAPAEPLPIPQNETSREFRHTAEKCLDLKSRILSHQGKGCETFVPLYDLFHRIHADLDDFRKTYSIRFLTPLDPLDLVYYDRLSGILFSNDGKPALRTNAPDFGVWAYACMKNYLVTSIDHVIKVCDHYQSQVDAKQEKTEQESSQQAITQ